MSGLAHSRVFIALMVAVATSRALAGDVCGSEDSGDCFTPHASPGCWHDACCTAVCSIDPFCCDAVGGGEWDPFCVALAEFSCVPPCPGDVPLVTPDVVDIQDLLFILATWGESGPPRPRGDVYPPPTGDDEVDVADLLEVLSHWGSCT